MKTDSLDRVLADPDLGRVYDSVLVKRHRVSPNLVKKARDLRGLPPVRQPDLPRLMEDPEIGEASDREMADRYGVSRNTASRARRAMGLESSHKTTHDTLALDERLGKVPHGLLAREYGVSERTVRRIATEEGALRPRVAPAWQSDPDLGRIADAALGARYGITKETVYAYRKRTGIPSARSQGLIWHEDEVERREAVAAALEADPTISNRELALQYDVAQETAKAVREDLGLSSSYAERAARRPPRGRGRESVDWDSVRDLGKVPDHVIAARLGVDRSAVAHARRARGIPAAPTGTPTDAEWIEAGILDETKSLSAVAAALGSSKPTAARVRQRLVASAAR